MNRISVIARNEFVTRIRTKGFIITTLLGPIILIGFFVVIGIVSVKSLTPDSREIAVIDPGMRLVDGLQNDMITFTPVDVPEDSARAAVLAGQWDGYLVVPDDVTTGGTLRYYTTSGGGSIFSSDLRNTVVSAVRALRVEEQQVNAEVYEAIMANVAFDTVQLTDTGEDRGNTAAFMVVGFFMGFLIYMAMLIYGSVVMQGVMQEKTNRVVEIIVSSVKPFDLLLGKVLGIGAMGLLQMTFWALLIAAGTFFSGAVISLFVDPASLQLPATASTDEVLAAMDFTVPAIGADLFVWFVLYFLGGYMLYATLFAAIGSAVESQQDAQGLTIPVMMPIIMSIVFIQPVIEAPDSTLALVLSLIPFTSPIPMVVRIAVTDVPFWEIGLSFGLLILAILGAVWIGARIYRVGILMYGKKATYRDIARWIRQS
jgi:ABC-2 type transport system permease protein